MRLFMPGDSQVGWRKSSFSWQTGNCVEVAGMPPGVIGVRDSTNPVGAILQFRSAAWASFVIGVRSGEFDNH